MTPPVPWWPDDLPRLVAQDLLGELLAAAITAAAWDPGRAAAN